MTRTLLGTTALVLLAGACSSPPAHSPVLASPAQGATPPAATASAEPEPPPDPMLVSVAAVYPPSKLEIDGDIREWSSLLPSLEPYEPPPPADPQATSGDEEPKPPPPSGPNPRDAASHLAVAITHDAILIAAELGEPAREGVWLGIGSTVPKVPPIGDYTRGGYVLEFDCKFKRIFGIEGAVDRGDPNPPEVVAACEALVERHAQQVARHTKRFARRFKIDRDGVRGVALDGTLHGFEGAKAAFKQGAKGATVEVSLPIKAMPRVSEAPLHSLRLAARAATSPKSPDFDPEWVWVRLPDAISFEPLGELRARAYASLAGFWHGPPPLSYQPGDPLHVETIHYPGEPRSVVFSEETLYTKQATLDDVEIGYLTTYGDNLAIFKNGKLLHVADLSGSRKGIVTRDGELHVISFSSHSFSPMAGWQSPRWMVTVVSPDGSFREDDKVVDPGVDIREWVEVSEFENKALDTFGVRGSTHYPPDSKDPSDKPVGVELTWRWDKNLEMYKSSERRIPVPRSTKKP